MPMKASPAFHEITRRTNLAKKSIVRVHLPIELGLQRSDQTVRPAKLHVPQEEPPEGL